MVELYKVITSLCEERGISGYRLCKDTGIQPSILTDLKKGRQKGLSAQNAEKIASYFGVSVTYLLGNEQKKEPVSQEANGLYSVGYKDLTPENQRLIDSMIEKLLKSQFGE